MKNWIFNVVSIIFIIIIFSIFLPESKVGKYAKSIISIFILLITVSPIIQENFLASSNEIVINEEVYIQEDFLYYVNDYKENLLKEQCNKILLDNGVSNALLNVEYEIDEYYNFCIKKVEINLSEAVINSSKPHKYNIDEIKNEISKTVGITKEIIFVYE